MKESDASRGTANAARVALANNGKLRIYSGSVPANVAASLGAAVLLVEHSYAATAFTDSNGTGTAAAIANATNAASGTASFARSVASNGTTQLWQHSVGTSAAEIIVPSTTYTSGLTSVITSMTVNQPDGT
jgi:hypothetical protein